MCEYIYIYYNIYKSSLAKTISNMHNISRLHLALVDIVRYRELFGKFIFDYGPWPKYRLNVNIVCIDSWIRLRYLK